MSQDPRETLASSPMTPMQILVVAITVGLTALDGFDVLSISFAAPGIARDWGIDRAALGIVLSMELIGMGFGSILIGGLADQIGRRYTMLGCVTVMALGMTMAGTAHGVYDLSCWRIFTGLGIGGILATSNAVAAEFSNVRRRDLSVSLMAIGYPLGAIGGGAVVAVLLKHGNWRAVFEFGAIVTALFIPIVFWWVPESVAWLCQMQPARALEKVNRGLVRLGHAPVPALPPITDRAVRKVALVSIFRPELAVTTVLVSLTYFLHITTFYFILKWVPKIVVDMGFAPSAAAGVLVWANVGGATGGAVLGVLAQRFTVKKVTIALLIGSTAMLAVFGHGQADLGSLSLICALTGFCTNGGVVGIYAVLARAFPTDVRAAGSGFALGTGRGGAMLAPIVAGILFQAGYGLQTVAIVMGVGSLAAAVCLSMVRFRDS
jgi:benzoate transport